MDALLFEIRFEAIACAIKRGLDGTLATSKSTGDLRNAVAVKIATYEYFACQRPLAFEESVDGVAYVGGITQGVKIAGRIGDAFPKLLNREDKICPSPLGGGVGFVFVQRQMSGDFRQERTQLAGTLGWDGVPRLEICIIDAFLGVLHIL